MTDPKRPSEAKVLPPFMRGGGMGWSLLCRLTVEAADERPDERTATTADLAAVIRALPAERLRTFAAALGDEPRELLRAALEYPKTGAIFDALSRERQRADQYEQDWRVAKHEFATQLGILGRERDSLAARLAALEELYERCEEYRRDATTQLEACAELHQKAEAELSSLRAVAEAAG